MSSTCEAIANGIVCVQVHRLYHRDQQIRQVVVRGHVCIDEHISPLFCFLYFNQFIFLTFLTYA